MATEFQEQPSRKHPEIVVPTAPPAPSTVVETSEPAGEETLRQRADLLARDRKRMEEEFRRRAQELLNADRRRNEFLALLAHELRNPLASIGNSIQILRTPNAIEVASPDELSLIPFPTDELFRESLHTFDLVVLQNFDYGPYQMAQYLPEIRRYVEEGGALAMLGGELSFDGGGSVSMSPRSFR